MKIAPVVLMLFLCLNPALARFPLSGGGVAEAANYFITTGEENDPRPEISVACKDIDSCWAANPGSPDTLISVTGTGTLDRIQIAIEGGSSADQAGQLQNATVTIVVDGTTVYNDRAGTLFALDGWQFATSGNIVPTKFRTRNIANESDQLTTGGRVGFERRLFINFSSSLVVIWTNNGSSASGIFTQIYYRSGAAPVGLYTPLLNHWHATVISNPTLEVDDATVNLLPSQSSGPGLLNSIGLYVIGAGSTPCWLEGQVSVVTDGVAFAPGAKGTEDFFGGWFYFANAVQSDEFVPIFVGPDGSGNYVTAMLRFFQQYPALFNSSLAVTWQNGNSSYSGSCENTNIGSMVEWYTQN